MRWTLLTLAFVLGLCVAGHWISRWFDFKYRYVVTHDAVVSARISNLGARIDGQIIEFPIREGQRVRKGDLIARFADDSLQARVEERRSESERAERAVESERVAIEQERRQRRADLDSRLLDVDAAQASLKVAQTTIPRWENEFVRVSELKRENAMTTRDLDEVESKRDSALALVEERRVLCDAARSHSEAANIALDALCARDAALRVLEADVEVARAGVRRTCEDLAATVISAPADGRIAQTFTGPGTSVRVGQQIASLWIDDRVWINAWVDETDLSDITLGASASITLPAYPDRAFEGRVDAVLARPPEISQERAAAASSSPLLASRAKVLLRVEFDCGGLSVVPGLSAVVAIPRRWSAPEEKIVPPSADLSEHSPVHDSTLAASAKEP